MNKTGFTLAETLITLAIIGVVAAMTVPSLIQKYKERVTVTAVKHAYSLFSQAIKMVTVDYPDLDDLIDLSKTDKENAQTLFEEFSKHIKKLRSCDVDTDCMPDTYLLLSGESLTRSWDNYSNIVTGVLANGTSFWLLHKYCEDLTTCIALQIGIDINGRKSPNKIGVDFFWFGGDRYGNLAAGRNPNSAVPAGTYQICSINNYYSESYNGYGCAEWIIRYGNMDYLKRDISQSE